MCLIRNFCVNMVGAHANEGSLRAHSESTGEEMTAAQYSPLSLQSHLFNSKLTIHVSSPYAHNKVFILLQL